MLIRYKCCFCLKTYDWYDGLYENPDYDSQKKRIADKNGESYPEKPGVFVNTNAITLCCVEPVDDNIHNPNPLSAKQRRRIYQPLPGLYAQDSRQHSPH